MSDKPTVTIIPTIGRIVLYCLAQHDVDALSRQRAQTGGIFISVNPGDVLPGIVVNVFGPDMINIKVFMDGTDTYWATSRSVSEEPEPGKFHWMPYQKQNAK